MKICVGIPAYDHKIHAATTMALLEEQFYARKQGHSLHANVVLGNSLVSCARDQIVQDFLDGDYDTLFFVDADVAWERGALTFLATQKEDVVEIGGKIWIYPEMTLSHWESSRAYTGKLSDHMKRAA